VDLLRACEKPPRYYNRGRRDHATNIRAGL
jgi:hypothetical protein